MKRLTQFTITNTKNKESITVTANNAGHAVAQARKLGKWTHNDRDNYGGWRHYSVEPLFELRISPIRIRGK